MAPILNRLRLRQAVVYGKMRYWAAMCRYSARSSGSVTKEQMYCQNLPKEPTHARCKL